MSLEIRDYYELLALHRAILEAKFNGKPNDRDLTASPILACAADKVFDALKAADQERGEPERSAGWDSWRQITEKSGFWERVISFVKSRDDWKNLNITEKRNFLTLVLSPFRIDDASFLRFLKQVDGVDPEGQQFGAQ